VSLDEIAAAAGLTKGAVYSNFTGKTDLLLALLDRYTRANRALRVCAGRPAGQPPPGPQQPADDIRLVALLLVEFWLYGMRDYTAGWRIADWYDDRRAGLAGLLSDQEGMPAAVRATLAMAMEIGLTIQHLLDPERVPAETYTAGMRLVLGPPRPGENDSMITAGCG
jgi:AcrR family transcriptional regulator